MNHSEISLVRRRLLGAATVWGLTAPWLAQAQAAPQGTFIERTLNRPVPGGVAVLDLGVGNQAPVVNFNGHRVLVIQDADQRWKAIVGLDLKTKPGQHSVSVQGQSSVAFQVGSKRYREQRITLKNKSHVNPDPQQQARFEREYEEQMQAYASFRTEGPSNVVFEKPVPGRLTSPFGLRRFFNGEERNPHSGLDFAAATGTSVKVPADGVVTIVADYFFNGKTVFVDHGQGLITMFCHLSAFDVKVGDSVRKGDVIARSGATGRATGPHLHWNVSLNNARVDPAIFIGAFQA
ncbi:M23 family metallopeptidase [Alcaligenes parafaecalis]|uniref:Peptidoglycan DD-metalloendopeptidase family protein n=1 Tax=Alcaligenes parafaecalis TaxID=171260 RepID=A0ABT3VIU6_9BURK|nr:M23 family metallopeptidase [Alcaligenes parafaecalis]MCX5463419.1 peptidoglycan DD-metalloendopeptidase family protein [Alcaligenes parafaecalis]